MKFNMSYVKQEQCSEFAVLADLIRDTKIINVSNLNYLVTLLCTTYIKDNELNYQSINDTIGVLECAKLKLYRRVAVPYESNTIKVVQVGSQNDKELFLKDIKELVDTYEELHRECPKIPSRRVAIVGLDGGKVDVPEKYLRDKRLDIISRAIQIIRAKNQQCYEFYLEPFYE